MGVTVRTRSAVAVVVALVIVAGLGVALRSFAGGLSLQVPRSGCTVRAAGEVSLSLEQMANAATIAAVGVRRQMPERAVVVALATAFQESRLENLSGGDRDSVGLFQQRPSQGWGTPEQIQDQRYAAARFYAALKKVRGWEQMRVTDAAQRVQRSAFPEAYEQWSDESAVLARALLGEATGAVACTVVGEPVRRGAAAAQTLGDGLTADWGQVQTDSPATAAGLALAVADVRVGWQYAHWLVSHATQHGVERVRFAEQEWSARAGGWSTAPPERAAGGKRVVAEVFRDRAN